MSPITKPTMSETEARVASELFIQQIKDIIGITGYPCKHTTSPYTRFVQLTVNASFADAHHLLGIFQSKGFVAKIRYRKTMVNETVSDYDRYLANGRTEDEIPERCRESIVAMMKESGITTIPIEHTCYDYKMDLVVKIEVDSFDKLNEIKQMLNSRSTDVERQRFEQMCQRLMDEDTEDAQYKLKQLLKQEMNKQ